ncbi:MAG: hypothetical protein U0414_33135 [Polyangiaceae bacterium]
MGRFVRDIEAIPERHSVNRFTRSRVVTPGVPAQRLLYECEVEGTKVRIAARSKADDPSTTVLREKSFDTEDQATLFAWKETHRRLRRGYRHVGRSRLLDESEPPPWILIEELFESGADDFLPRLLRFDDEPRLARLAPRWLTDPRPWARRALLAYIDDGCDRWGHRGLVKRLFQGAEAAQDDELMGHFLVAFDRLIVRIFGDRKRPASRGTAGRRPRPAGLVVLSDPFVRLRAARRGDPSKSKKTGRPERFARPTRRYLARRAWRYFRVLGYRDPKRYGTAIRGALRLYEDASLRTPLRLLDAWGLLHALFHESEVLRWGSKVIDVETGRTLAELVPSPRFPAAWEGAFDEIVVLLATARSRTVRGVVAKILEDKYSAELRAMSVRELLLLLESEHEEAQRLGILLLATARGGAALAVDDWLRLLRVPNVDVTTAVVSALRAHLDPSRLGLAERIDLAMARVARVAELGAEWLAQPAPTRDDVPALLRLRDAPVPSVRARSLDLLRALIERDGAKSEWIRELVDARLADARALGLALLEKEARHRDDPALFLALVESPFADVQAYAVREAERWLARAPASTDLRSLWATLVLSANRGSREKLTALRQIVGVMDRGAADDLVPLLAVALRSVRGPERLAALSAVASAAVRNPSVRRALAQAAPELAIGEVVSQ